MLNILIISLQTVLSISITIIFPIYFWYRLLLFIMLGVPLTEAAVPSSVTLHDTILYTVCSVGIFFLLLLSTSFYATSYPITHLKNWWYQRSIKHQEFDYANISFTDSDKNGSVVAHIHTDNQEPILSDKFILKLTDKETGYAVVDVDLVKLFRLQEPCYVIYLPMQKWQEIERMYQQYNLQVSAEDELEIPQFFTHYYMENYADRFALGGVVIMWSSILCTVLFAFWGVKILVATLLGG